MCGRFAQALAPSEYIPHFQRHYPSLDINRWGTETEQDRVQPRYNVPPRSDATVIRRESGSNVLKVMNWGIVPHWTKQQPSYADGLKTINARSETLIDSSERSALWMSLAPSKRCVIPVQGFYEWLNKGGRGTGSKAPYYTRNPSPSPKEGRQPTDSKADIKTDHGSGADEEPPMLMLAGLWDECIFTGSDTPFQTFTILTTRSSPRLAFLHTRMPCLLRTDEEINSWLACEPGSNIGQSKWDGSLGVLLKPFGRNESDLACYPVPVEVGKVGNQDPSFIRPVSERKDGIESFFRKQETDRVDRVSPLERIKKEPTDAIRSEKRKAGEDLLDERDSKTVVLKKEDDEVIVLDDDEEQEQEKGDGDIQDVVIKPNSSKGSKGKKKSAKAADTTITRGNAVIQDNLAVKPEKITSFFPKID